MKKSLVVAGAALASALVLSGCTGGDQGEPKPPEVTVEQLTVPTSLERTQPYASVAGAILPATDSAPYVFGGSLGAPGEASSPAVWVSGDGASWEQRPVDAEFTGSFTGELAGDDSLSVLAGLRWADGVSTTLLWTSTDREKWKAVDLPKEFAADYRFTLVAAGGGKTALIGTDTAGASAGVVVTVAKGKTSTKAMKLPKPAKDQLLGVTNLAGNGTNLVLMARPGPEGEPAPTVAYRSSDGGETWTKSGSPVAAEAEYIYGVTWTGTGYVATGTAPETSDPGSRSLPAAWSSADGSTWTRETLPTAGGELNYDNAADAALGAPSTAAGRVGAVLSNDNAEVSGVMTRSAEGAWSLGPESSVNENPGVGGLALPTPAGAIAVVGQSGYLRVATIARSSWSDGLRISSRDPVATVLDAFPVGERALITTSSPQFEVSADHGWRRFSQIGLTSYSGGKEVAAAQWDPPEAAGLTGATIVAGDDGQQLVLGTSFPPGNRVVLATGYFRASADAAWTPVTGFPTTGASNVDFVARTGDTWTAVGSYSDSSIVGTVSHGAVWTSVDGIQWTRSGGDFGSGTLESSVVDVCTLPDGTPIVVGWLQSTAAAYRTAAWVAEGDGWKRVDLGKQADRNGFADGCASDEDGVVIAATIAGRTDLLRSTDGEDWKRVFHAERGMELSEPVAVDGGFAAAGNLTNATSGGPVVWLSANGEKWTAYSVESRAVGSTIMVAPFGKDLLIGLNPLIGNPLSTIPDVAEVIAR